MHEQDGTDNSGRAADEGKPGGEQAHGDQEEAAQALPRRPEGASDELVEALGRASEGFEYLERARGHLFSLHQLIGRADLLFGEAADQLEECGCADDAELLRREVVGRNVLDGRWTFQIVEEFDDLYYGAIREVIRGLEDRHMDGRRHVFESEMKERRRSRGRPHHEPRPPAAHDPTVDTGTSAED